LKATSEVDAQLNELGIAAGDVHRNLPAAELTARALARGEGILAANGALVVKTGARTGRSPADRFIVDEPEAEAVAWNHVNQKCSPELFDRLLKKAGAYLRDREVFAFDGFVGADREHRLPVRVVADAAWHALFAHTLFLQPEMIDLEGFAPGFTVIDCGACHTDPDVDGTRSAVFVGISFRRRIVLILGTLYAGEIKKALFTVMNYLLPENGVLPLHCAANVGPRGDVALYFGLSGTGKTTLSADPHRRLVGDDEHGWADYGIFNFEGGCYAKVIRLSPEEEPQIYQAIRFGSVLENVVVDPMTRAIHWDDDSITENTRATYPVEHIPGAVADGEAGPPRDVFFLTCDAMGVMPPISKLVPDMASYHFLSGFTAKVAGTETEVQEPSPTFSTCFGAPFMPRDPVVYASMLRQRLAVRGTRCWLVNTGWSGGPYGVGKRMSIPFTRRLLQAALGGELDEVEYTLHPVFRVLVPASCRGIPDEALDQRGTWEDPVAYDRAAARLARQFMENFRQYESRVPAEVAAAGPIAREVPA
jgi:phosphoenolpyruvate carboxykinase (ATP)